MAASSSSAYASLRLVLDNIVRRCLGVTVLASSDDILLAVRASQLATVFRLAIEGLAGYDLQVNLPKCHAYCPRQGALQEAGLPEELPISYEGRSPAGNGRLHRAGAGQDCPVVRRAFGRAQGA